MEDESKHEWLWKYDSLPTREDPPEDPNAVILDELEAQVTSAIDDLMRSQGWFVEISGRSYTRTIGGTKYEYCVAPDIWYTRLKD